MDKNHTEKQILDWAEELLSNDFGLKIKLSGQSMFPVLRNGDWGLIIRCSFNEIRNGDIVVMKNDSGKYIAHRLIRKKGNLFITKGDNNLYYDKPFPESSIVGKVIGFERAGKKCKLRNSRWNLYRFMALLVPMLCSRVNRFRLNVENKILKIGTLKSNLRIIQKGSTGIFILNGIISVFQGVLPFLVIVLIKLLIDHLTNGDFAHASNCGFYVLLILTSLAFLLNGLLNEFRAYWGEKLSQSVSKQVYQRLHDKHARLDLSAYEHPEKQNRIHRAVQEASYRPQKILNEILNVVRAITSSLFFLGIFIFIKWYLALIIMLAVLPEVFVQLRFASRLYKQKTAQAASEREMYYYNRVLTGFPFAKEMKLFQFPGFFRTKFQKLQNQLFQEKIIIRKSDLQLQIYAQVFAVLLIFCSLGYVSFLKINGAITIGTVVLFFFAFQRGYSVMNDLFRSATRIVEDNVFLNDFVDFLNSVVLEDKSFNAHGNFELKQRIVIENLSFRYETSLRNALSDINIEIFAGQTVAFVGENGSGKTTLIKLLCGFYQPDSGKILLDDTDLKQIGGDTLRKNIAAVFQDFALYYLPVFQNIALGNYKEEPDKKLIMTAAEAAGIADVIEQLPKGYETLLGNQFSGGEELSIGQWQKMAIARAFYRDAPLILLDEPSSALDAASERQVIDGLKNLSRDKTAVIVSHRLSTVRWVDKIFFFENGTITEHGTHDELMSFDGGYRRLYNSSVLLSE
ncbi:MAG: signal peptidase I [Paludibacter sp.]|nr:signal peptidase I [Paludibacter sp.]